ncbi:hypothetical protein PIB30_080754 [Stylosanthes scabra]|uniref:Zinc finger GRF-type domain-containing protein n=1 Tax=Stylosanthes scabra TaxID=79078 RepID=A0ABU6VTG8_9FABA|nr:hypothetical protein [Stylosanthes scabra]
MLYACGAIVQGKAWGLWWDGFAGIEGDEVIAEHDKRAEESARMLPWRTPSPESFWNEGKSGEGHCDFFRWVDQELPEEDPEKAKLRKEVLSLKLNVKACEWRLKMAAVVAMIGWLGLFSM